MASTIGVSASGTTFFSGTFSGIDTQSLIQNAVNAKLLPKKRLDDQVSKNTNIIAAYQKVQSQANSLKLAFDNLKSSFIHTSAFDGKTATYSSSNPNVTASSILTASVANTAQAGTYDVVVNSTAKSFVAQGASQGTTSAALGVSGSFDIGETGKTAVTVNFSNTDTLADIASKINATTATSGVSADILQVATGQYKLIIRGADTNQAVNVTNITGTNVLNTLGVVDGAGAFLDITQPPSPASITLNGTPITSNTNSFSNVLTGLTLNISGASPTTTITVKIGNDTTGAQNAIKSFVDAYNTLRGTIADLTKINADGTIPEESLLYNDGNTQLLLQSLSRLISTGYGASPLYSSIGAIGISIGSDNKLAIDSTTLTNALTNHFTDVQAVFATSTKFSANSNLQADAISGLGYTGSFDIGEQGKTAQTINVTAGSTLTDIKNAINGTSATTGVTANIVTLGSGEVRLVITGADDATAINVTNITGTDVLTQLGITSSAGSFANNNSAQGLADYASTMLDSYANIATGSFQTALTNLQSQNTDLQARSDDIETRVEAFQQELINKYAKLEAIMQNADTLKKQITAILEGSTPTR